MPSHSGDRAVAMAPLPLAKLGSLLIKTLAKPVAKNIKSQAGESNARIALLEFHSFLTRKSQKQHNAQGIGLGWPVISRTHNSVRVTSPNADANERLFTDLLLLPQV